MVTARNVPRWLRPQRGPRVIEHCHQPCVFQKQLLPQSGPEVRPQSTVASITLVGPWAEDQLRCAWTPGPQKWERINVCCFTLLVCGDLLHSTDDSHVG